MRRNVTSLLVCSLIVVLSGCALFRSKNKTALSTFDSYAFSPAAEPSNYEPLELPAYEPTSAVVAPDQADWALTSIAEAAPSASARYHTVAKRDTLYSLARQYYGDQTKWKEIFATNRTTISDPNRIHVGQRLLIP